MVYNLERSDENCPHWRSLASIRTLLVATTALGHMDFVFPPYFPVLFRYPDGLIYTRLFSEPILVYQLVCAPSRRPVQSAKPCIHLLWLPSIQPSVTHASWLPSSTLNLLIFLHTPVYSDESKFTPHMAETLHLHPLFQTRAELLPNEERVALSYKRAKLVLHSFRTWFTACFSGYSWRCI